MIRRFSLGAALLLWSALLAAAPLQLWYEKYELNTTLEALAAEFTRGSGLLLTVTYMPNGELRTTAMRSVAQGSAPDLLLVPSDFIGSRTPLKLSSVPVALLDGITAEARATITSRNGPYGVPLLYGNHLLLMYNKTLVSAPAADWQTLLSQQAALAAQGVKLIGWKAGEMYWLIPFLTAFGADPVVNGQIRLDTPAMAEALSFYKAQIDSGVATLRCGYECSQERYLAGEFAYAINGDWSLVPLQHGLGVNFGVTTLPTINGRAMRPYSGSIALLYPGDGLSGAKREALQTLTRFLLRPEVQQRLHAVGGLLPANAAAQQQLADAHALGSQQRAIMDARLAQLALARPMPPEPEMAAAWAGLSKGFTLLMRGRGDAAAAAKLMQKVAEQELARLQAGSL
ncbi:MAG: extracellular solute-binding protein [Gammaproteobacteria bacterium]|nr:extracellular solute-binding protein [Gammaproteobacteria bacterium]